MLSILADEKFLTSPFIEFYCNSSSSTFINRVVKIAELVDQANQVKALRESTLQLKDQNTILSNEVDKLKGNAKTASELKAEGFSAKEIAANLGISVSAASKRAQRGQ
jgi:DNA-directed RNA polymerase specialized sigma24 family protein